MSASAASAAGTNASSEWRGLRPRIGSIAFVRLLGALGGTLAVLLAPSDDPLVSSSVAVVAIAVLTCLTTTVALSRVLDDQPVDRVVALATASDLIVMLTIVMVLDPSASTGAWIIVLVPVGEATQLSQRPTTTVWASSAAVIGLGAGMMGSRGVTWDAAGRWLLLVFLAGGPVSMYLLQAARVQRALLHANRARERLRELAARDELTGLLNRRGLDQLADGRDRPAGVLFVDLDGFKQVNDRHGHEAGDAVLRAVGDRLREAVADAGDIARIGGDEFAIVLHAEQDTDRLRRRIESSIARPILARGDEVRVGASVGVASPMAGSDTLPALLDAADAAMYHAKSVRDVRRAEVLDATVG